jgi:hypothetical protein
MCVGVTCDGHNEDDMIEFSNFLDEDDTYTNMEFLTFIHPYNDELTYVYDAYDFDYCESVGVSFTSKKDAVALAKKNKPKSFSFKPSKKHTGKKEKDSNKKVTDAQKKMAQVAASVAKSSTASSSTKKAGGSKVFSPVTSTVSTSKTPKKTAPTKKTTKTTSVVKKTATPVAKKSTGKQ